MQLLIEVAERGSFAAAARQLELDPSSVSRGIAAIESDMGLRLFERSTRKLRLTEVGELYIGRLRPLLEGLITAHEEALQVTREPAGSLRMTASVAFGQRCLLPHVAEFRRCYPSIRLELQLTDSVVDILQNRIDLACRLAPPGDSRLIGTRLFDTRYRVCASPDYLASSDPIRAPADLETHRCIVFTLPEYRSRWIFKDRHANRQTVAIQSDLSISSAMALRDCALSGMGPALLADWLIRDDLESGRLTPVLENYEVSAEDFDTAAWLLYPSRDFLPAKTRVMIDFLKSKYS